MTLDPIPQASPLSQYLAHRAEIDAAVQQVMSAGRYILGHEVEEFEKEYADYIGTRFAIGVASGTDALVLALRACKVGPGDEVITSPHTAVATVAAIELAGAVPVLVDIEPDTFLIDPSKIENAISSRTRAIIPVHLFGQPADLSAILAIAQPHAIHVIEDCAQAHGALYRDKRVGNWGIAGCFSFYPTKNLGAIGDGGMVVTDDENLASEVRKLREYGWRERFISEVPGLNSRLDEIQAAILRVKLRHLDRSNDRRRQIAEQYTHALSSQLAVPVVKASRTSVFHQYVVRSSARGDLQSDLRGQGVGTAVHYPTPIHLQPAYRGRIGDNGSFPVAERAAGEILSLPLYPELDTSQIERVINAIRNSFAAAGYARI
jgi:dTDP-4-amino-4,6-dideoxygalactose transaminase